MMVEACDWRTRATSVERLYYDGGLREGHPAALQNVQNS